VVNAVTELEKEDLDLTLRDYTNMLTALKRVKNWQVTKE